MTRAFARLKAHWVRHLLAALQVAVGVAAVTAVVIDVVPMLRSVQGSQETEVFSATYGGFSPEGFQFFSSAFTMDDIVYLQEQVESIEAIAALQVLSQGLVRSGGDLFVLRGTAKATPGFAEVVDMRLTSGRFFNDGDLEPAEPQVAVVSAELAEILFPGRDPIGETINIRPDPEMRRIRGFSSPSDAQTEGLPGLDVRVIGVFEYPEGTPSFSGFFSNAGRVELFLPANGRISPTLQGIAPPPPPPADSPGEGGPEAPAAPRPFDMSMERFMNLYFRATKGMGQEAVAEVQALLEPRIAERYPEERGENESLRVEPASTGAAMLVAAQLQGALILGAMGIAALIVSGFSIFTTFLAGVAERVRSIGLARALGATRGRILREVVGEAALLSTLGGIVGVIAGFPVRSFAMRSVSISIGNVGPGAVDIVIVVVFGLLVSAGLGAIAALYPGWTVARMMPAEAFHEE